MVYQLPSGKCVYISVEIYLKLTDEELLDFIASISGYDNYEERFNVTVTKKGIQQTVTIQDDEPSNINEDNFTTLNDITFEEKISDLDFYDKDELEND